MSLPILYSFRRCPYAMRARLAIDVAGIKVELREIVLRNKPEHMLEHSPKGTVPVLLLPQNDSSYIVIDESRDIMDWALSKNDPENWLDMPAIGEDWIKAVEGPFKQALDRYKYSTRFDPANKYLERDKALEILETIDTQLRKTRYLFGDQPCLADMATVTFIRQYANTDREWFDALDLAGVQKWLTHFLESDKFSRMMEKYTPWKPEDSPIYFPPSQE